MSAFLNVTTAVLRSRLRQGSRCELLDPRRCQSSVVDAGHGRAMANRDEGLRHGEGRDRSSRQGLSQNGLNQNGYGDSPRSLHVVSDDFFDLASTSGQ